MLDLSASHDALTILHKEKVWRQAVHRDQIKVNKRLAALRLAAIAGDKIAASSHRDWLLSALPAKRNAVAQLLRAGKALDVWSYHDVVALADSVTVADTMDEPALVFAKKKTSKIGFRTILSFGDRHKVAHRLLANVINAQTFTRGFQLFDAGVPKAIARIMTQIDAGNLWLAHLDIENFFPSFTTDGLTGFLSLPHAAVDAALTGRNMVLKSAPLPWAYPYSSSHLIEEARRGLPQGAASSPAVSHSCVAQLALDVADLEPLFNYEDDFLLVAKSKAELEGRVARLTEAVGSLPGGQFALSLKAAATAETGIDFLGHRIRVRDGKALAEPSEANYLQLVTRLHEIENAAGVHVAAQAADTAKVMQVSADMLATLGGWKSAFRVCDKSCDIWQFVEGVEADVCAKLAQHGVALQQLPPPSAKASLKARRFFYYKWFG